jgi:TRAP-type transport system periplasmic protein
MSQRRLLQLLFALICAACLLGVFFSRASQAPYTLKVAFLASPDDEDFIGAMAFKLAVEKAGGGRIAVRIYPSGQFCGNERECIEALQSGVLEMHQTTIGGLANLMGAAQVLDLPYAFDNDAIAECVVDGPLVRAIGDQILADGKGLRLMVVGNTGGWRAIGTTNQSVRRPADLKGLKIRSTPSALEQEMVRELGAFPTPLPFSEIYSALGSGLLDGTKNSVQDMAGMKFHEEVKHVLLDRHSYMASLWWFSQARWQALPPDIQAIVQAGFVELGRATRQAAKDREAPALATFRKAGATLITPTPAERQAFIEATKGVRAWYASRFDPVWLSRLDRAVADCQRSQTP